MDSGFALQGARLSAPFGPHGRKDQVDRTAQRLDQARMGHPTRKALLAHVSPWRLQDYVRLRNKGLPSVHGYGTGDLLVNVNVYVPEKLSDKETKIMKEWETSSSFEPSKSAKKTVFSKFKKMFV